jgi:dihydrofolate synthase/folylpolyglutamate synthase
LVRLDARIDWERRDRGAMRVDLGPMRDLARRLDQPQGTWRSVHVGGSNGKGSVAALVEAGLRASGRRTGTYSSPHVERVTERVCIDGREVADDVLATALEAALDAREAGEREGTAAGDATWFDLMTAAAFVVFREQGVEWAVVEVGLGGRLDSTNVIEPEACVLTRIDLEHTALLGDTLAAIAGEKAGILKSGAAVVSGVSSDAAAGADGDAAGVVAARADALGLNVRSAPAAATIAGTNLALAREVLDVLGERSGGEGLSGVLLDDPALVSEARLPGRLERARLGDVPVVLDGAHVAASLEAVLADLALDPALAGPCVGVVSLGREKDASAFLKALRSRVDRAHCTSVPSGIHLPSEALVALATRAGLEAQATEPARLAVARAADEVGDEGWVLVTGSFYLIGAVRGSLTTGGATIEEH